MRNVRSLDCAIALESPDAIALAMITGHARRFTRSPRRAEKEQLVGDIRPLLSSGRLDMFRSVPAAAPPGGPGQPPDSHTAPQEPMPPDT